MSVSFAVLKAKDCTGTIGNGRPVIGRPVETPYRQSTMKARTSCAVLIFFLGCAAMKRACPETQPPDQMQAQCEAPEVVVVATSKARPQGMPAGFGGVPYAPLVFPPGNAPDATGQIQYDEAPDALHDEAPTAADAAHHDATNDTLPLPLPTVADAANDNVHEIVRDAFQAALPAAAAAAEAAGSRWATDGRWVTDWLAAGAALHQTPTLGPHLIDIRVPICPSVFPHDTRHQADEAAQAAQAAQDPPTRYYALYEEPLRHPMAQWLADVCAPHGQFPKISRSQDDWVVRWLIRFDTRIEAETTEAFRIQAAAIAAICRRWPSAETQAAAIAAAAEEAGLPDWVHDWLAEYEARLIGWETPSWLVRWLQASIWQYAERRAARIRERLRAIAKATSSSSSSSRPA